MTKEERLQRQRQRLAEMRSREDELHRQGFRFIAGVDEVGRGPLAGPVVTAAVVLPPGFDVPGIDDSKKLSEKRREELYEVIMDRALAVGIAQADHQRIDEINILQATKEAMREAVKRAEEDLRIKQQGSCVPAGNETLGEKPKEDRDPHLDMILLDAVELEGLPLPQEAVVKGDSKILCIAAASIVAKVTRDRMMVEYGTRYPGYAFERNKGYGTKAHYEGLRRQGPCPIHRRTFIRNMH